MTRLLGAALLAVLVTACRPAAPRLSLLFLGRSPAALLGGLSWAPDADSSRIVGGPGEAAQEGCGGAAEEEEGEPGRRGPARGDEHREQRGAQQPGHLRWRLPPS